MITWIVLSRPGCVGGLGGQGQASGVRAQVALSEGQLDPAGAGFMGDRNLVAEMLAKRAQVAFGVFRLEECARVHVDAPSCCNEYLSLPH